jgi:NADH oxidase (H2O2-forming)
MNFSKRICKIEKLGEVRNVAKNVVIVGGGIAGIYVMRNLLEKRVEVKEDLKITLIKSDSGGWVSVCGLPYALRGWYEIDKVIINNPEFFKEQGVDFRTETEVVQINTEDRSLKLKTGDKLNYDYLVIATGRTPALPDVIEKSTLENIHTLSTMEDARKIEVAFAREDVKSALVRGRGIIAIQSAAAAATKGLKTTVLAGPPSLLPSSLDPDMGDLLKEWLEKQGIEFILENKPITALKSDGGRVKSVVIGEGGEREIPADMVIVSMGMRPNTKLARDDGIETGETGGIVTDNSLHVKKGRGYLKDVYALGDCIQVIDGITLRPKLNQLASTAVVQANVISDNIISDITGDPSLYSSYDPCVGPVVAEIGGLQFGSVGLTSEAAALAGIKTISGKAKKLTKARYFPGAKPLTMKLIFDAFSKKLIGAQMISEISVSDRVNEMAVAIRAGITAEDLRNTERCFDPSLSLLVDVTVDAAQDALGIKAVY